MLMNEVFQGIELEMEDLEPWYHSRSEIDWHQEMQKKAAEASPEPTYMLLNKDGKVVRRGLTPRGARIALTLPDYLRRYGKMSVRKE